MSEPNNGQALPLPQRKQRLPNGHQARYTGETLLRTRPKTYHKIVHLLADPNWSALQISKACRVSENTLRAVRAREARSIDERKKSIVGILSNVAESGAERMSETIGKAGLRDASIGTGIAVDKMLALTGQMPASVNIANIVLPTPEERARTDAAHRALDEISKLLRKEQPLTAQEKLLLKVELAKLKLTDPQEGPGELPPISNAQDELATKL